MSAAASRHVPPLLAVVPRPEACLICGGAMDANGDAARRVCSSCKGRPEARRLGVEPPRGAAARAFTPAERSLIRSIGGHLPTADLLRLLNERLHADLGPDASGHTLDALRAELGRVTDPAAAADWSGLRRVLAEARRSGVLPLCTPQLIDDFSVVFSLTPAQRTHLQDVLRHAREDR